QRRGRGAWDGRCRAYRLRPPSAIVSGLDPTRNARNDPGGHCMGQGKAQVNASPTKLRKAIAQARTRLKEHIRSLSDSTLPKNDLGAKKMQTKKIASAHTKTSTKSQADSKSDSGAK